MIRIVPYDSHWPAQYAAEAANVRAVLGDRALRIEHVGSTSVPGLAAKLVIDIQVSVATLQPLAPHSAQLGELGYHHIPLGPFDNVYPFFQKPAQWPSTHHVHLCVLGDEQERRHLAFRDYLRGHPAVAAEYAALKRTLAVDHDGATLASRERYSSLKTGFIDSVLERAFTAGYPLSEDALPRGQSR